MLVRPDLAFEGATLCAHSHHRRLARFIHTVCLGQSALPWALGCCFFYLSARCWAGRACLCWRGRASHPFISYIVAVDTGVLERAVVRSV